MGTELILVLSSQGKVDKWKTLRAYTCVMFYLVLSKNPSIKQAELRTVATPLDLKAP